MRNQREMRQRQSGETTAAVCALIDSIKRKNAPSFRLINLPIDATDRWEIAVGAPANETAGKPALEVRYYYHYFYSESADIERPLISGRHANHSLFLFPFRFFFKLQLGFAFLVRSLCGPYRTSHTVCFFLFCFCVFSGFPCCFSGAVESLYLIKTLFQLLRSIGVPEQNDIIAYSLQYFDWAPLVYDQRMDGNDWWLVSSFSFPFIFRRSIFLYLHREWSDWFVVVVVVVVVVFVIAFSVSTAQFPTK